MVPAFHMLLVNFRPLRLSILQSGNWTYLLFSDLTRPGLNARRRGARRASSSTRQVKDHFRVYCTTPPPQIKIPISEYTQPKIYFLSVWYMHSISSSPSGSLFSSNHSLRKTTEKRKNRLELGASSPSCNIIANHSARIIHSSLIQTASSKLSPHLLSPPLVIHPILYPQLDRSGL